jgi:hypothetical protein
MDLKCHLGLFRTAVMSDERAPSRLFKCHSTVFVFLTAWGVVLIPARERIGARGSNPRAREK